MGVHDQNLLHTLFTAGRPAQATRLIVATGYASSAFVYHLLEEFEHGPAAIELRVGMAPLGAVSVWDHKEFKAIADSRPFNCKYRVNLPADHRKIYAWATGTNQIVGGFIGSANFSWSGFRDLRENLVDCSVDDIARALQFNEDEYVDCLAPDAPSRIPLAYKESASLRVDARTLSRELVGKDFVDLSLLTVDGNIPTTSGINWGQRPGRDRDQAYISVPVAVRTSRPGFFPPRSQEFTIVTDDGESFLAVVAQDDDKAIETKRDNAELGRYLRRRLGVPLGSYVDSAAFLAYGRDSVRIYKLSGSTYYLDFRSAK